MEYIDGLYLSKQVTPYPNCNQKWKTLIVSYIITCSFVQQITEQITHLSNKQLNISIFGHFLD